ncbi:MAG: hypothetical protein AB1609_20435, partial [Bacillota bacterium]
MLKKVAIGFSYLVGASFVLVGITGGSLSQIVLGVVVLVSAALATNLAGVRSTAPGFGSVSKLRRAASWIGLAVIAIIAVATLPKQGAQPFQAQQPAPTKIALTAPTTAPEPTTPSQLAPTVRPTT